MEIQIWVTRIPDIDIGRASIVVEGNNVAITGNNYLNNTAFRMAHFDLNGTKQEETIEVEDEIEKFSNMFQLVTARFQDKTLIAGKGIQNSLEQGLIYVMNDQNELDTLISLEPQDRRSVIWDVEVADEEFYTFHEIEEDAFDQWYKKINKFDKDLNLIWSYKSEITNEWQSGSIGTILNDGRVILIVYTPNGHSSDRSIRAINEDESIDWQYNPPNSTDIIEGTFEIEQLSGGELLGYGRYSNTALTDPIENAPYLYKMTTEGEIKWKRVFYEIDPTTGESRRGFVRDAVELDNGDIYGIGEMKYDGHNETFIFKVDADGCLDAEDCDFVQLITDVGDVEIRNDIKIYPNPVSDILTIGIDQLPEKVEVYTTEGVLIKTESNTKEIDVNGLSRGVYYVKVYVDRTIGVVPFVK